MKINKVFVFLFHNFSERLTKVYYFVGLVYKTNWFIEDWSQYLYTKLYDIGVDNYINFKSYWNETFFSLCGLIFFFLKTLKYLISSLYLNILIPDGICPTNRCNIFGRQSQLPAQVSANQTLVSCYLRSRSSSRSKVCYALYF